MYGAANVVGRLVEAFLGPAPPVGLRCWDGTSWGDPRASLQVHVRSPDALRRLLWDPDELGLARAHVAGELDVDGSIFDLLELRDRVLHRDRDAALRLRPRERSRSTGSSTPSSMTNRSHAASWCSAWWITTATSHASGWST